MDPCRGRTCTQLSNYWRQYRERLFELRTDNTNDGEAESPRYPLPISPFWALWKTSIENLAYIHPLVDQKGATNTLIYLVANKSVQQCKASFTNLQNVIIRVLEFELFGPRTPGRDLGWQSSLFWLAAYPRGEPYLDSIAVRSDH